MKKQYLHDNWTLSGGGYTSLSAVVPGCVHTDLKRNGLLPDYFWRDENERCQWIEKENWSYTTYFDADISSVKAVLHFNGLDTYADIYLNGIAIGEAHNMFIPHSYDVSGLLQEKNNKLDVCFRSPIKEVEGLPKLEGAFTTERLYTRRLQCTYYWDWVDRFVTCGIYGPVYLVYGDDTAVDCAYIYTEAIDCYGAGLNLTVDFTNPESKGIAITEIFAPDNKRVFYNERFVREKQTNMRINVSSPKLWYPRGYGDQPLYTLKITVGENVFTERFGIRTLRVAEIVDGKDSEYYQKSISLQTTQIDTLGKQNDVTPDPAGFIVLVNGVRIYCRGANWVPCEPFPSEETEEKIRKIVALSAEAGVNMIRIWGGGLFEKDCLYDACDEAGILVTQDFLMACGSYPEKEDGFLSELQKEAAHAVKKLRNHACLAWWSGDNENATLGYETAEDHTGRDASLIGLEPVVRALDPNRRYHLSSPYGGKPYMSVTRGTTHTTNFFGEMFRFFLRDDLSSYKEHLESFLARFIVEEPVYGMPQKCSLLRFLTEQDLADKQEKMLRFHSKTNPCVNPTLYDYGKSFAEKILGGFSDDEDRLFKYRYVQYEWIRVVNENARRNVGYNDGLLYWMLNDCWPASMGWSIIDYYNLPKAAYYSFKRCAKPVIGSVKQENGQYVLYVSSDGSKSGDAKITARNKAGDVLFSTEASVNGYGVTKINLPISPTELLICDVCFDGQKDRCFYRNGDLPLCRTSCVEIIERTKNSITLKANDYVHAVELLGNFVFSDNFFSMLNGETITIDFYENGENASLDVNCYTIK